MPIELRRFFSGRQEAKLKRLQLQLDWVCSPYLLHTFIYLLPFELSTFRQQLFYLPRGAAAAANLLGAVPPQGAPLFSSNLFFFSLSKLGDITETDWRTHRLWGLFFRLNCLVCFLCDLWPFSLSKSIEIRLLFSWDFNENSSFIREIFENHRRIYWCPSDAPVMTLTSHKTSCFRFFFTNFNTLINGNFIGFKLDSLAGQLELAPLYIFLLLPLDWLPLRFFFFLKKMFLFSRRLQPPAGSGRLIHSPDPPTTPSPSFLPQNFLFKIIFNFFFLKNNISLISLSKKNI